MEMQAAEVDGASQHGEGRVVERFVGFGVAPAFDGEVGEGCSVLAANGSEECMQSSGIFEGKDIAGVEDGLGFMVDGPVEKENIGD